MGRSRALKAAAWCAVVAPAAWAIACALTGRLGANPVEALLHRTGFWALVFLLASLLPTAAGIVTGNKALLKVRRLLGLAAFGFACAHLAIHVVVDQGLDMDEILRDVLKRPFITLGMAAWAVLIPLAVTSTTGWVQRLGARNWKRLHRATYVAAVLGVLHFAGGVKADLLEPALFGVGLAVLLLVRAIDAVKQLRARR